MACCCIPIAHSVDSFLLSSRASACCNNNLSTEENFDLCDHASALLNNNLCTCDYFDIDNITLEKNKYGLFLIHLNMRSLHKNYDGLCHLLSSLPASPEVICISETKIKNEPLSNITLPGYSFINVPSPTNAGGVGVYVSQKCYHKQISSYNIVLQGCENLWLTIECPYTKISFVIGIIYRHPNSSIMDFCDSIDEIFLKLTTDNKRYFILGDINIDTSSASMSNNGNHYLNLLASHGVASLIDKPTRVTSTTATVLDHILTNETLISIKPGVLCYDLTDHYPVFIKLNCNQKTSSTATNVKLYRPLKHFNPSAFCNDLEEKFEKFFNTNYLTISENNLNCLFDQFYSIITSTIDHHAPKKKLTRKQKKLQNKPWLTKGLLKSIKNKQKMYKTHFLGGNATERYLYKLYANKLNKIKELAKKNYFHEQIFTHKNNPKKTWELLKTLLPRKAKSPPPISLSVKDNKITDPHDIAETINQFFANVGKNLASKLKPIEEDRFLTYLGEPTIPSIYLLPSSPKEVTNLIKSLNSDKATGFDDIPPYFLKVAAHVIAQPLSMIFNHCMLLGIFPNKLKTGMVIPVYKNGPADEVGNYRPISLLTSLDKIFEKILNKRFVSFLKANNILVPVQFGFRNAHSTVHPILDIMTSCYDAIQSKMYSSLLFLDIKKAFDSVCHKKLLSKLQHYGFRGIVHQLLNSYLSQRKQFVYVNNVKSSTEVVNFGVPQGSILGPLLFLIYINDLPNCLNTIPRFFADDTALMVTGRNIQELQTVVDSELQNVSEWMTCNSLTVNPTKSTALIITPYLRKPLPQITEFSLNKAKIQPSAVAKYLGVYIDDKLSFKSHISYIEKKISRSVGIISKLHKYLPCKTLLTMYYSLVHTHLLYALPIWASTYDTYLNSLKKLQNKALRIIMSKKIRDKITPLYYKLGILKLNDLYTFEIAKLMHQYENKKLPIQLQNYFSYTSTIHEHSTRGLTSNSISLPRFSTTRTQRSFKYVGAKIWNNTPNHIKELSFTKFKVEYKNFLLQRYNN